MLDALILGDKVALVGFTFDFRSRTERSLLHDILLPLFFFIQLTFTTFFVFFFSLSLHILLDLFKHKCLLFFEKYEKMVVPQTAHRQYNQL